MPIETTCTSCGRPLRVPDELMGRQVKCPSCGTTFTAGAARTGAPAPAVPEVTEPYDAGARDRFEDEGLPRTRATGRAEAEAAVKAPAIALLVAGILGALVGAYFVLNGLAIMFFAKEFERQVQQQQQQQGQQLGKEEQDFLKKIINIGGPAYLGWGVVGILGALVTILGAAKMMRLNSLGLARTGSILAMIPVTSPCCILGLPFGIWALVVLNKPEVRSSFQ